MLLGRKVGLDPSDIVLDGDPAPFPQNGGRASPQFSAHVYCGQTASRTKMPLGMGVGFGPSHILLHGDPAPLPKKGAHPQFSAHVYFGQTAAWIKIQDATWYRGRPRPRPHCARWGASSSSPKRGLSLPPPIFSQCLLWPNGWMDQDATWHMKVGLGPGRIVLHGDPAPSPKRGTAPTPAIFGPCLL